MTLNQLRVVVALLIMSGHVLVFALLLQGMLTERFLFTEWTTAMALMMPLFAGYTASMARFYVAHRRRSLATSARISAMYAFVVLAFPVLFVATCSALVLLKGNVRPLTDFENFKIAVAVVEATFAVFVVLVVSSVFGDTNDGQAPEAAVQRSSREKNDAGLQPPRTE